MSGYKIVLTADRSLMSTYGGSLFLGFATSGPVSGLPFYRAFMHFILRPVPVGSNGEAILAPYGLRAIEASLIESGVADRSEVIVAPPRTLSRVIGDETRIIGISTMDPKGLGPASSTFSGPYGIVHSESYTTAKFKELLGSAAIRRARERGVKIVVGGYGAWQLDINDMVELGIDYVVVGEGEIVASKLFKQILEDTAPEPPKIITVSEVPDRIPRIQGGTIGGLVEVSRGCGRGCYFCSSTLRRLRHRPLEDIIHDVEVNAKAGLKCVCLHAEDILHYGGTPTEIRPEKVLKLFESAISVEGIEFACVSHAALASIAEKPDLVEKISELLSLTPKRWMGFQTGIETGSPRLIEKYMRMKPYPFKPNEWPEVVENAFAIANDNNWIPAATLIVNLPGETEDDVLKTVELVERLRPYKSLMVPLLYVPIKELSAPTMRMIEDAKWYHWELYRAAWRHNMKWLEVLADEHLRHANRLVKYAVNGFVKFVVHFLDKFVVEKAIREKLKHTQLSRPAIVEVK